MQQRISAQPGPKLHNYLCACPFFGHYYFGNKCFTVLRTCDIMCMFHNMHSLHKFMTRNMLTKNEKNLVAEFGKMLSFCYHFVII